MPHAEAEWISLSVIGLAAVWAFLSWKISRMKIKFVQTLLPVLDSKDQTAYTHCLNAGSLAAMFALHAGMIRRKDADLFEQIARAHDIGKLSIPDAILHKPDKLTPSEFEVVKKHIFSAEKMLVPLIGNSPFFSVILYHHEKYDGSGYPFGLKGENIPLHARMMAIVDSFAALSKKRAYRPAMDIRGVFQHLRDGAGAEYDPALVSEFVDWLDVQPLVIFHFEENLHLQGPFELYFLRCSRKTGELVLRVETQEEAYRVWLHYRKFHWEIAGVRSESANEEWSAVMAAEIYP